MWNDKAVPAALMELGVAREDAFNYVPVGCNELAIPGQCYFNPGANANYLQAIEAALTDGKGYRGQWKWQDVAPPAGELASVRPVRRRRRRLHARGDRSSPTPTR